MHQFSLFCLPKIKKRTVGKKVYFMKFGCDILYFCKKNHLSFKAFPVRIQIYIS